MKLWGWGPQHPQPEMHQVLGRGARGPGGLLLRPGTHLAPLLPASISGPSLPPTKRIQPWRPFCRQCQGKAARALARDGPWP